MGGSGTPMDGISAQPGRPSGVQHSAPGNPRHTQPHRHIGRSHRDHLQPLLRIDGSARRNGRRPSQPQVGHHHRDPLLERRDHVHRTCNWRGDAHSHAKCGHRRRRGILRPGQLLAPGTVSHRHPSTRHVHPPDFILCGSDPRRMACRIHR